MAAKAPSSKLRTGQVRTWQIPGFDEPFVQDPLTFYERNEFFAMVGRAVENLVMTTGDMYALVQLFGLSDEALAEIRQGKLDDSMLMSIPNLIGSFSRLLSEVPGMLEDIHLLALSVPPERRDSVLEGLRQIDDETGFGITETFIEQNAETMRDFLPRWRRLLEKLQQSLSTGSLDVPSTT